MNTTIRFQSINPEMNNTGFLFEEVVTVRRILAVSVSLMVLALTALGVSTAQSAPRGFGSSFNSAVKRSQSTGKPLFVMIARTGCSACAEMESHLNSSSSQRALSSAVKVRLEAGNYPGMTSQYAAGGTPTTLVFASGNYSSPVYTYTGVMDSGTISQVGRSISSMSR